MMKKPLFKQIFALLVVIGVLNYIANTLHLYWTVWWFDNVMHFISGFCIGMLATLSWQYFVDNNLSIKKALMVSLVAVIIIGVAWEIFEAYFDIAVMTEGDNYVLDTTSDLALDIFGSLLGGIYAYRFIFK